MLIQRKLDVEQKDYDTVKADCKKVGMKIQNYLGNLVKDRAEAIRQKQSESQGK